MAKLTLTFDNGPEPAITHHVLNVLASHGIKSTFFLIGKKLESPEGRAAVERAKEAGHWIGNHSYTHSVSLGDSDDPNVFDAEVTRTQDLIGDLAHPDKLFRPFCNAGIINHRVFKKAHVERLVEDGYTCVMFNCVTQDWEDREGWVDRGLSALQERPWTNMVLHDIAGWPTGTETGSMQRLDEFLSRAQEDGHKIIQDFAADTLPIVRGEIKQPMDHLTN